jgi:hypothetical protein
VSALPIEDYYESNAHIITNTPRGVFDVMAINNNLNYGINTSFMVNVSLETTKSTHISSLMPDDFITNKSESESESVASDSYLIEKFKKIASEYATHKSKALEAKTNFIAIRDCYGVVDSIITNKQNVLFEARIYQNTSSEFVEVIRAPLTAFKQSDAELLNVGSVFYWKAGYRSTSKGTRVKVNDFNLRRIIREKSIIRQKRVEKVVDELLNIFK